MKAIRGILLRRKFQTSSLRESHENESEFKVTQRTQDGMFNATALLKQWNSTSSTERKMDNYFNSDKTQEFVNTIMSKENLNTPKMVYLKSRGINGGTWMNPMLFIDFAMWINPSFKYDVIKFVYDELIRYRNEAGDAYRELASAVVRITPKKEIPTAMTKIAQALNFVCTNHHEKEMRNQMDETTMKEMVKLEQDVTLLINEGILTSIDSTINYLRRKWNNKYRPQLFA